MDKTLSAEENETCPVQSAMNIQYRAAAVGFDWDSSEGVLAKLEEELDELTRAIASGDIDHARSELGDLIFTAFSMARFLRIDPCQCISRVTERFKIRFAYVEKLALEEGKTLESCSAETLNAFWEQAKKLAQQ